MKCILGVEPANWSKFPKFKWWPADIPWSSIILSRKHQNAVCFHFVMSISAYEVLIKKNNFVTEMAGEVKISCQALL